MKQIVFPTFLWQENLGRRFRALQPHLLREAFILGERDQVGRSWSKRHYHLGYTSYQSEAQLHRMSPHYDALARLLRKPMEKMVRSLDWDCRPKDIFLSSMWVNIMPKGASHSLHIHPLSVLSGTVYLQVPRGSSAIKFEDPRLGLMMAAPAKKGKRYPCFVEVHPKIGDLVMFESWLRHEVPRQTGEGVRVSVSFNWDWQPS